MVSASPLEPDASTMNETTGFSKTRTENKEKESPNLKLYATDPFRITRVKDLIYIL